MAEGRGSISLVGTIGISDTGAGIQEVPEAVEVDYIGRVGTVLQPVVVLPGPSSGARGAFLLRPQPRSRPDDSLPVEL